MPESPIVYYLLIYVLASACVVIFSSKPVSKAYDFAVDGLYKIFMWLINNVFMRIMGILNTGLVSVGESMVRLIEKTEKIAGSTVRRCHLRRILSVCGSQ